MEFFRDDINIALERTVSQIFDLGFSFYFI